MLSEQFDAWVWFEETNAVRALSSPGPEQDTAPDATATL